jgi:N6-adenosine-specific RNA methylase IME4
MQLQNELFDLTPLTQQNKPRFFDPALPGRYVYGDARKLNLQELGGVPFKGIILDPPWEFEVWEPETGNGKGPEYPVMTMEEICDLPIPAIADKDCILYLWSVNPAIDIALEVIKAYGFTFKTKFPWIKTTTLNHHLSYGTGYWVRGVSEDVIIATRGDISAPRLDGFLGLIGPNVEHSRKPQDVHSLAESTTPGPYLEVFSRYQREGWVCFGNENRGKQPPDRTPSIYPPWLKSSEAASPGGVPSESASPPLGGRSQGSWKSLVSAAHPSGCHEA